MKYFFLIVLTCCSIFTEAQIKTIPLITYDKDGNVIGTLDFIELQEGQNVCFKDTSTENIFRLDPTHRIITALSQRGDTLWQKTVYKEIQESGHLDEVHFPDVIGRIKLVKKADIHREPPNELTLYIICEGHAVYGYIDLTTGKYHRTGQD